MKIILKIFGILCSMGINISCQSIAKKMDNAFEHCLKEFKVTVDEFVSTDVNLTCFDTCVAMEAGIIEDKKFNLEKYTEYLVAIEDPYYAIGLVEAYKFCVEGMLDIEDECELYVQLEKCVAEEETIYKILHLDH